MMCQFCGASDFSGPLEILSTVTEKKVFYYSCKECASICQDPVPGEKELEEYYNNYKHIKSEMNPGYLEDKGLTSFFSERDKTLKEIGFDPELIKESHNAELGCANGFFLHYLHSRGASKITGVDISRDLLDRIALKQASLIRGDLTTLREKSVDNLFLFNVAEHVRSITTLMEQICFCLKDEGKLVIEVPLAGFIASSFKKKWRFLMPDEHLHIPSLKGLRLLLARYNLVITGSTRFGSGYTAGMINGFFKSIFDTSAKVFGYGDRGAFLCEFVKN